MNLCSDGHKEVCYEGNDCPCCEGINEQRELDRQIEQLTEEAKTKDETIEQLRLEIRELK